MLIPRTFNSRVQVIAANAGKLARISYNPKVPAKMHIMEADVESSNEVMALRTMAYSMTQFTENNFTGDALLVSFRAPVVRGFELMKLIKAGIDPHTAMIKDWMLSEEAADPELVTAIEEFISAYENCTAKISFGLMRNAYVWDIEETDQKLLSDDSNTKTYLVFNGEATTNTLVYKQFCGETGELLNVVTVVLEAPVTAEIKLRGEYEVTMYGGTVALKRPNNSKEMLDMLNAIERVKELVPSMSLENAEVITGTDGF